ncbi:MAG: NAD(+) synthase, partial [Mycoplasma sp.]
DNNVENVVIGISGGVDSAVSLAILNEALPKENINAYFIGIESSSRDCEDAKSIANSLDIKINEVNLTNLLNSMKNEFNQQNKHAVGNLKSRMRMMFLYDQAFNKKALVIGNSNLDELYTGYFTKFGDNGVDICLLNGFLKRDVFMLAEYYNLPPFLQTKKPSAGLSENQSDEEDLGIKYKDIDKFLSNEEIDISVKTKIINLHNKNKHKLFYNYDMNKSSCYKGLFDEENKLK